MNHGWEVRPLGDVCRIVGGGTPPKDNAAYYGGGIPWATVRDLGADEIASTEFTISQSGLLHSSSQVIPAGRVVIASRVGLGKVSMLANDTAINQDLRGLIPFNDHQLSDKFLFYCMRHLSDVVVRAGTGATVKGVKLPFLRSLPIPMPPPAEQERIVRILDEALTAIDRAKAHTQSNIHNLDALSQATLDEVLEEASVTGVRQALSDVLSSQPRNGWSPPAANHAADGTPILTLSSVTGFQFQIDKIKHTSAKTDPSAHYWVRDGDLLMTRSNTPRLVGHVAVADGITRPMIYPDLIMRMRLNETRMLTPYAYFLLRTTRSREYLTSRAGGASQTMSKITKQTVQAMPVLVPSLEAQADAVARLKPVIQGCRETRVIAERKATLLDQLRSATLARAFSGNL